MHQQLHLAYFDSQPDIAAFDVKDVFNREFFGVDFVFRVIGDSHYIEAPEIEYYELFSCKPIQDEAAVTVDLTVGERERVVHTNDSVSVKTNIIGKPLTAFDKNNVFDVKYRFETDAFTTIKCVSENTYNTYHTYPEYNLALHTENTLTNTNTDTQQRNNNTEHTLII